MNDTIKQIGEHLKAFAGKKVQYDEAENAYIVFYGSTVLKISTLTYGGRILVEIMAFVVQDVTPTPALMEHLLFLNYKIPVGAFSLVERDIFYSHVIFAEQLTMEILEASVAVVARMADNEDDYIVLKYGGERAIDKLARPTRPRPE